MKRTWKGFFQGLDLPRLSKSQKSPTGKAPGPDGFTAEFFKYYVTELTPILLSMYNEAFLKGELPATLSKALIALVTVRTIVRFPLFH